MLAVRDAARLCVAGSDRVEPTCGAAHGCAWMGGERLVAAGALRDKWVRSPVQGPGVGRRAERPGARRASAARTVGSGRVPHHRRGRRRRGRRDGRHGRKRRRLRQRSGQRLRLQPGATRAPGRMAARRARAGDRAPAKARAAGHTCVTSIAFT
jgi:hypothetical protein